MKLSLISWNVNGIRAAVKNGFLAWLDTTSYDIVGLQEIKAIPDQLSEDILQPEGYHAYWNPAKRKGYSGTALYSKQAPNEVTMGFQIPRFDEEGRVIVADYDAFTLMNIYYPNGQKDEERLKYKMDFYDAFLDYADGLKKSGKNLIITGDFNTAHTEIDLANPKANEGYSGFLPIERAWLDKFISHGYIDTFRRFHPGETDQYTWWTYRVNARERNIGWRIDYFFVSEGFLPKVKDAFILPGVQGSDHCPVGIEIEV
ncbi:MAG: exodeoxyribonuclease III [Brevinematales bacterium]|nr:exodeoxyribonuclease III [Brevinematales bacterium]